MAIGMTIRPREQQPEASGIDCFVYARERDQARDQIGKFLRPVQCAVERADNRDGKQQSDQDRSRALIRWNQLSKRLLHSYKT